MFSGRKLGSDPGADPDKKTGIGKAWLLPLFGYSILALLVTWPLVLYLGSRVPGNFAGSGDLAGTVWLQWWVKHCLLSGNSFAFTTYQWFPVGMPVVVMYGSQLDALASIPLQLVAPFPLSYNLFCLMILLLNGLGGYLLVFHLGGNRGAAWVGGAFFIANSLVLRELQQGRPTQAFLGSLLLFLLFFWRAMKEPGWKPATLAGLFLAITGGCYWFYALFALLLAGAGLLVEGLIHHFREFAPGWPRRLVLTALVFALLALPLILPYLSTMVGGGLPGVEWGRPFPSYADLTSQMPYDPYVAFTDALEAGYPVALFPVILLLALPLLAPGRIRRSQWAWWAGGLLFYLLSLGPYLKYQGLVPRLGDGVIPLPYLFFYQWLPFFTRFSWTSRLGMMVVVVLGVLAAWNLAAILGRPGSAGAVSGRRGGLLLPVTLILILAQLFLTRFYAFLPGAVFPISTGSIPVSSFYRSLASQPGQLALIELPLGRSQNAVYYITVHGKPLLGGMGEGVDWLLPAAYRDFLAAHPLLVYFKGLGPASGNSNPGDLDSDRATLRSLGFGYVVIRRVNCSLPPPFRGEELGKEGATARYRSLVDGVEMVLGDPVYADDELTSFRL